MFFEVKILHFLPTSSVRQRRYPPWKKRSDLKLFTLNPATGPGAIELVRIAQVSSGEELVLLTFKKQIKTTSEFFLVFLQNKRWDNLPRCGAKAPGEESPDRAGHPTGESPDGSNLMAVVTENNRLETGKGENARQELTMGVGDAIQVRCQGLQDQIYWQTRAARPMPGGRLRR